MSFFVFVDNSNVWIEGKIASAVAKGWAKNHVEAHRKKIKDSSWRIDFDKSLYKEASAGDTFVLVMGDKDFIPALEAIRDEGCCSVVAFWNNASGELICEADRFIKKRRNTPSFSYRDISHEIV